MVEKNIEAIGVCISYHPFIQTTGGPPEYNKLKKRKKRRQKNILLYELEEKTKDAYYKQYDHPTENNQKLPTLIKKVTRLKWGSADLQDSLKFQ